MLFINGFVKDHNGLQQYQELSGRSNNLFLYFLLSYGVGQPIYKAVVDVGPLFCCVMTTLTKNYFLLQAGLKEGKLIS